MLVKIKWNKQVFDDVELDPSNGVEVFKSQIYSLTGNTHSNDIYTVFLYLTGLFRCSNGSSEAYG